MLELVRRCIEREWPLRPLRPFLGLYNPFDLDFHRDPYPHLDRLRARAPVYYSRPVGSYLVSSYAGAHAVLSDTRFTSDRKLDTSFRNRMTYKMARLRPAEAAAFDATLTAAPPDDHQRMRNAIRHDFSRSRIERLGPRIEAWVDVLLDRAAERGGMDVIADFSGPLPVLVAAELLGLPPSDAGRLQEWSDSFIVLVDPFIKGAGMARMRQAYGEFDAYLVEAIAAKAADPGDDLISRLVARRDAGELTDLQVRTLTLMLLTAGHEVITNLVGNAVMCLLRNPDERARLAKEPEGWDAAVEEVVRLESPIQSAWRIATTEVEVGGRTIPAGRAVTVLIGAANHDPERFDDPHRFDPGRADNRHVGFALGSHYCAGPWLARIEGGIALRRLQERFPGFRADPAAVRWKPAMGLRGVYALPLDLAA
jgi:cytochrome P450